MGRLLITFLLCAAGALQEPILYLSLFFKTHRNRYYDLLNRVRSDGVWEQWLEFFLIGVRDTSEQAVGAARRILKLHSDDKHRIESLGRPAASVLRVFHLAQTKPILSIASAADRLQLTFPTVSNAVEHMQRLGILQEITGKQRHRAFVYDAYFENPE